MNALLKRSSVNFFKQHPMQLLLAILGIALGVAVVAGIDLAKGSALTAFDEATRAIAGRATHRIIGGPGGLDEALYVRLRLEHGGIPMAPKVEGHVKLEGDDPETLRFAGLDIFAEVSFQPAWRSSATGESPPLPLSRLLTEPATVLMSEETAESLNVRAGDPLHLIVGTTRRTVDVAGILAPADAMTRQSVKNLLIADIAAAQELLAMIGRLTHIDLILKTKAEADDIAAFLPPDARLLEYGSGDRSIRQMTRAFYTNISALSLLSLVVGMFLIYNTMTFMVVQRRQLIGSLRALGVTRAEVFRLILAEAGLFGAVGTLLGTAIGIILGQGLLELISQTISAVFASLATPALTLSSALLAKSLLLGLGATLLSALLPAIEATRVPPLHAMSRSRLESRTRALVHRSTAVGIVALLAGLALAFLSEQSVVIGFAGLLLIVLGCALATPAFTLLVTGLLAPLMGHFFGIMGRLPPRSVRAGLSRTGVAIGALMVAVATTIGMQLMVDSFRFSLTDWLETRVNADFYVSAPADASSASDVQLDPALAKRIAALEEVAHVGTVRYITLEDDRGITKLTAYRLTPTGYDGFTFTETLDDNVWEAFERQEAVIVSEAYAFRNRLAAGDEVELRTDFGLKTFPVVGVYTDFNAGGGIVAMSRSTYDRHWHDPGISAIWVYAAPGADVDRLRTAIHRLAGPGQILSITSNRAIVDRSLEIFDQAFIVTEVLRWLAAAIAFVGVFSALMALQLERTREFGILRANGLTPRQLWGLIFTETGLMGFVSGLLAMPGGCIMALLLIFGINRRSFGWSMSLSIAPEILLQGLILAVLAALLAGIYPALRISRTPPAEALRNE
ncbi:MAG: FtsX-like permease family protein [Pseudomonadota bacterium]